MGMSKSTVILIKAPYQVKVNLRLINLALDEKGSSMLFMNLIRLNQISENFQISDRFKR